jgi:hypothetical protein
VSSSELLTSKNYATLIEFHPIPRLSVNITSVGDAPKEN